MARKNNNNPANDALHETEAKTTFEGKVNKYGFLHFGKSLRETWGITKG